jgi:hypothetical protein
MPTIQTQTKNARRPRARKPKSKSPKNSRALKRRMAPTRNMSRRVTRPAAVGRILRGSTPSRIVKTAGTEPIGEVQLQLLNGATVISLPSGCVVLDMLLNPTIMSGASSRLAALAGTYSQYRFTSLKVRVVSNMSTAMTGGVTWCLTRDVDADALGPIGANSSGASGYYGTANALQYAQSAEANMTLPVWESGTMSVNCSQTLNRQRFFDMTPSGEIAEACQFRLMGVISSTPGVVGSYQKPIGVQVFIDYTLEMSSPQGVENRYSPVTLAAGSILTAVPADPGPPNGTYVTGLTAPAAGAYFVNPAIPAYMFSSASYAPQPCRGAFFKVGSLGNLVPYTDVGSAVANPDRPNLYTPSAGGYVISSSVNIFFVKQVTFQSAPTLAITTNLTDEEKKEIPYLDKLLKSLNLSHTGIENSYNLSVPVTVSKDPKAD